MRRGTPAAIEFGTWLRDRRLEAKLTMRGLASKLGVPPATVSQIEKGQRALKEYRIEAWAGALGVSSFKLRKVWKQTQIENPDPPWIVHKRKTTSKNELDEKLLSLSGPERDRVKGYIDALIAQRENNEPKRSEDAPAGL